jgi:cardiolipin synthase
MGIVIWFRLEFIPWTRGRMFRTGVSLDQPVVVTDRVVTMANGITLIRLLGLPVLVYLLVVRHAWLIAFVLFGALAVLDSMDGYVARRFNQCTKLGSALDPWTDRLTVLTVSITLVVVGVIPVWFVVLVVLRDVLLLALVVAFIGIGRPAPVRQVPVTRVGKLATLTLLVGLPFLLLAQVGLPGGFVIHIGALFLTGGGIVLYYIALGQYLKAGLTRQQPTTAGAGRESR